MFFFEKKNQKTFLLCGTPPDKLSPISKSFFASFFQKRKPCFGQPPAAPAMSQSYKVRVGPATATSVQAANTMPFHAGAGT
jgi:hypothetical protein